MSGILSKTNRQILALAIAIALPLFIWAGIVEPVFARYQFIQDEMTNQQMLLSKYRAHANLLPKLQAQKAELEERSNDNRGWLQASNDALAAAQLQATVTNMIARGGGQIASMQILPSSGETERRRVRVSASIRAPLPEFYHFLYEMEAATPFVFVDSLEIHSANAGPLVPVPGQQAAPLSIRLQVSSFRKMDKQ